MDCRVRKRFGVGLCQPYEWASLLKSMKTLFLALLLVAAAGAVFAQDIALPLPKKAGGMPLMEALAKRSSARSYDSRELSPQQLADMLWAGWGINRADGRRTAPSASNKQENEVYVLLKQGSFVYDPLKNVLRQVSPDDARGLINNVQAPVVLVYVADLSKRGPSGDERRNVAAIDSAFISQNIYLYCASEGLATVYRGGFNREALPSKLNLKPDQQVIALQPVGFPK